MTITGIVAVAQNLAIGKDGKLPWHYSSDLKFFRETTLNNIVVMGFHTWKSIGKSLPQRFNIVLSHSHSIENQANLLLLESKTQVIALSKYLRGNLFIIGGAKTYKNFADVIQRWIVTEIPLEIKNADAFMPPHFLNGFEITETKILEDNLSVKIYDRKP